ncbi:kinase-like domain-containing protein [Aspergillus cavernicola]|uniref:Kinase-like domain-containing protein n=1 Tax=Aspergillus cavernicola TaxID=176166 RepID=A0ABR4IC91_9EURO
MAHWDVYRYFRWRRSTDEYGYLFMEYVPGQNLQDLDIESLAKFVPRVVKIAESLGRICGSTPGPVGGGIPLGYIYGDDGAKTRFKSVEEMNVYMNKRLAYRNDTIDLSRHPLVLCHGDLCRRNIILREDGSLCLVDWGFAGYYPRFFEIVALKCTIPYDKLFEGALEREAEAAMDLADEERHDMKLVTFVRGANLRWSFDGPTQAERDAFIESLERHAKIRQDNGVNSSEQAAAGDEKQEEPHSIIQPIVESD